MNLSLKEKISALYLCADILDYPDEDYKQKLNKFQLLIDIPLQDLDLNYIESEYLNIFSIQSTKLRCVPYASWWIDGKMSGVSLSRINDFYNRCGYVFDIGLIKKPIDHISLMIIFIAILLEENKVKEIKEFTKFLTWIDDFENSLAKASKIKNFQFAINLSSKIINSLKEEVCVQVQV